VLRGKATDKVAQFGHERLSTFGVGAGVSETRWRGVLRQLIALGHLRTEGEFNTYELTQSSRDVLRGDVRLLLREGEETPQRGDGLSRTRRAKGGKGAKGPAKPTSRGAPAGLDAEAQERFAALKAWRAEVARSHNLPAFVVFHDATLTEMARAQPATLHELAQVSGVGVKKLEAYGEEILRVLASADAE
jgi:ATP-dependent DNA helicase RecQ